MSRTRKHDDSPAEQAGPVVLDGGTGSRNVEDDTVAPVGPVVLDGTDPEDQERAEQAPHGPA